MCKDCGRLLKFFIIGFNTILFLLGACLAGVAGYTAFHEASMLHNVIMSAHIHGAMTGLYILMVVGIVMAIVSILGCIGASNENRMLLWLSFFFVLLLFIMQLVAVILCFYKYKVVEREIKNAVKKSLRITTSKISNDTAAHMLRSVLKLIEEKRKCCGLNGPQDYEEFIPDSCRPHQTVQPSSSSKKIFDAQTFENADGDTGSGKGRGTESVTVTTSGSERTPPASMKTTTAATKLTVTISSVTSLTKPSTKPLPYRIGCISHLTPIIYAAEGIGIAVLLLELLLVVFIGMLLCEIGKEYESLA